MLDEIKFMEREPTELEKMSFAELIIYLAMEGYTIDFRKYGNNKINSKVLLIELKKDFLGNCYKKTLITCTPFNKSTLSSEAILKSDIIHMLPAFDKYNEIKKKVTT